MKFTWDKSSRRYRNERGQFSSSKDVRKVIDELAATTAARTKELGQKVRDGKLSVPKFQALMAKEIKNAHTAALVLAKGGRKRISRNEWLELARKLKSEFAYIKNFAKDIPRTISERGNKIPARAAMYGNAVIGTFENAVREREKEAGMLFERRVMGGTSEPCVTCIAEAGRGYVAIGKLKAIGDSECRSNCACWFEFSMKTK